MKSVKADPALSFWMERFSGLKGKINEELYIAKD